MARANEPSLRATQAFMCIAAAAKFTDLLSTLSKNEGIPSEYIHHLTNRDENCQSYQTHKYVPVNRVNEFMHSPEGRGVFGGWTFSDGSMLLVSCPRVGIVGAEMERYTIIQPEIGDLPKCLIEVTFIRAIVSRNDCMADFWDKEVVEA